MSLKREPCDIQFSYCVRAKANWSCEHCGKSFGGTSPGLHCAHIHGRRHNSVRWSLDNAVSLCAYHHRYFTENPTEFFMWLEKHLGRWHLDVLLEKKNAIFKGSKYIKKEVAGYYRELLGKFGTLDDEGRWHPHEFSEEDRPEWLSYN